MSIPFNLFLVENDSAVRNSLVRVLELQGYSVHAYASGQEFLEVFDPACFGCIILDVNMPKFSGHWQWLAR